jgi:hypothetical protein
MAFHSIQELQGEYVIVVPQEEYMEDIRSMAAYTYIGYDWSQRGDCLYHCLIICEPVNIPDRSIARIDEENKGW